MARAAQKEFDKNGKFRSWKIKYRYKDYTGKTIDSTKCGFKKKKDAENWLNDFMKSKAMDFSMPFKSFVNIYFQDLEGRLRENTIISKRYIVDLKITPYFGEKPMNEITASDVRSWQNTLLKEGYKPTYLKTINVQLSAMFNYACKYHDLKTNPCHKAGSMGKSRADEMNIWTKEEFMDFSDEIMNKRISWMAFTTLYWTGIRIGELLALTVEDIDLEKCEMRINKSYQRLKGKDVITEPKTPKSKRIVTIPKFLVEYLKEYMDCLYGLSKKTRLFNTTKSFLEHEMLRGVKASGVKKIRLHDLRHSHASLLIEMGWNPVAIAERLGHEKVTTTLNTYAHLFPNKQKELAESLDKFNRKGF